MNGIKVEAHFEGWPKDPRALDDADTILLFSDGSDRRELDHPLLNGERLAELGKLMKRGVGFIAIHYTVFVPAKKAGAELLDWIGGYFDYENGQGGEKW